MMRDDEFITALKNIVECILSKDISISELTSLLHKLEIHDIWDSNNLMITDCYFAIKHMREEHIQKREWEYFLEYFNHQRSFDIEEKLKILAEFPDELDHAVVLEYSDFGNFGTVEGDDRMVRHFAICQYPNDASCYLFLCTGYEHDYDVIIDDCTESVEACKKMASRRGNVVWHNKQLHDTSRI